LALALQASFTRQRDDTPSAALYLAVRAARRACAANPADAQAYLILGECYLRLAHDTRERAWGMRLPELIQLRRAQASIALNRAIALKPDLAQAHLHLGLLYNEINYLDLALEHLQTHFKLTQESAATPRGDAFKLREQKVQAQEFLSRMARSVQQREEAYQAESVKFRLLDRAQLAFEKGLVGKALDLLLETDVSAFGPQGMTMELELMLNTGRARTLLDWAGPEQESALGSFAYHWLRIRALAGLGDYAQVQEESAAALGDPNQPAQMRQGMAVLVGRWALDAAPPVGAEPTLLFQVFRQYHIGMQVANLGNAMKQRADLDVLRGILAMEQGDVDEAQVFFHLALDAWKDETLARLSDGQDSIARIIAQNCLALLE
jgi:hypothetical protein